MYEELQHHVGKYYGKYSGDVIAIDEDKDNTGSIVVQLPTMFGKDARVTARPCLPYGHFYIPAVGSKVWVEFEGGNVDFAIWVGTWYSPGQTPPQAAISPPENRVIQTASGHTIEIMDKAGEEKITIKHKGNAFISIDKNGSILIANQTGSYIQLDANNQNATFVEQHGNIITMSGDGVVITEKSGSTVLQMTDDTVRVIGTNIILQSSSISLTGDPAAEPTLLANSLAPLWNAFALHTHAAPGSPPVPPGPLIIPGVPFVSSGTVMK